MRKMLAHIVISNSKVIWMSAERFRIVKCNENIWVWKCHNQNSRTLRTTWGKSEGLVRCVALRHQSFLLHMALTDFLRSSNVECEFWSRTGSYPTATIHFGAVAFILVINCLNSPRQFQMISYIPLTSLQNKGRVVLVWRKRLCLWVDSLICTEHARKGMAYHYQIKRGGYGCQVYALWQRHTMHQQADPYQIDLHHPKKKMQSTWLEQKVAM